MLGADTEESLALPLLPADAGMVTLTDLLDIPLIVYIDILSLRPSSYPLWLTFVNAYYHCPHLSLLALREYNRSLRPQWSMFIGTHCA